MTDQPSLRDEILALVRRRASDLETPPLLPGVDPLPVTGKVIGAAEVVALLEATLDRHLTGGRFTRDFEKQLAGRWPSRHALFVNSGSSANLLAVAALTSPKLGAEPLRPGDEVITAACGFPTTVAPALQLGLRPVYVDVDPETYAPNVETVLAAVGPRTRLVMLAHPVGNPFRADVLADRCRDRGIRFVEDCCDALGATIGGRAVGTFGDFATCSFYPAHHLTTGEGGAVLTQEALRFTVARSFRDWGRDCWCEPGVDDTCGRRFRWQLGTLPPGYDHKYVYSHLGFNLKATEFQAALGLAQLERLEGFVAARRRNHRYLTDALVAAGLEDHFRLPAATPGTEPSWFSYALTCRESGRRAAIVASLERAKIGTRPFFAGNLLRHPAFANAPHRVAGDLAATDRILEDTFCVGIWPGLGATHLDYLVDCLRTAVTR